MVRSDDSNEINGPHPGYDYTPPKVKLCNDGSVRENCDVCPQGTFGTYPNCKKPQCAQGNCTNNFLFKHKGIYNYIDKVMIPPCSAHLQFVNKRVKRVVLSSNSVKIISFN